MSAPNSKKESKKVTFSSNLEVDIPQSPLLPLRSDSGQSDIVSLNNEALNSPSFLELDTKNAKPQFSSPISPASDAPSTLAPPPSRNNSGNSDEENPSFSFNPSSVEGLENKQNANQK